MSKLVSKAKNQLIKEIKYAVERAIVSGQLPDAAVPDFLLEIPSQRGHGDWAANVAMVSARTFRMPPQKIALCIQSNISLENTYFDRCETAGPGFLNFFYGPRFYPDVLADILKNPGDYGKSDYGKGERVMVEFVSANPTGPMHMGNARGGALGDCLAAVLDAAGYEVFREFYINDAGNQLEKFGLSLDIRYRQIFLKDNAPQLPQDSYHGEDIAELAKKYVSEYGDILMDKSEDERRAALTQFGLPINIKAIKRDMKSYAIEFDRWFYESELHRSGAVDAVIDQLKARGATYEKDGAIWCKTTEFGLDKDEVIVRANGNPTYYTADLAYHKNKFDRGFERLIDIWGADHHGHVARMKAGMKALGYDDSKLDIVLMQFVRLVQNGETVRMSKRTGKSLQLRDLLDEVSTDAARFIFNMYEYNTAMDFDLDLAVKQDSQNPVYYVQYAYARICSIFRTMEADGIILRSCSRQELELLNAPEEIELMHLISAYTDEIISAAKILDPSKITRYAINVATVFHKFYNTCRVKGNDEALMMARMSLCMAAACVIKNILNMFKISAPESM